MTRFPVPAQVQLQGLLGDAQAANLAGRLSHFIVDPQSEAIALFGHAHKCQNHEGDWHGEHAGKWLYAAARAANRSGDAAFTAQLLRVADYLVGEQEADGYLGTYAPERRFTVWQGRGPCSWDGAPALPTWDIWTHSYLILGMLEVHRFFPNARYLDCARRIGDLCLAALTEGGIDITHLGNHHGMSATVLLDPAAELFLVTGEQKYLKLALRVLEQANARPELNLLGRALAGVDAAEIATGQAHQLCWNLVGLAKLHRATGKADYLWAVRNVWASIHNWHLSLGGGPWGGVAHRSPEVFNHHGAFSPYGTVETCSTFSWIQLNRELLAITGEAVYAEEIERSAYNDLLGAQAPNGEDWCSYIYPNGKRVYATDWRCCKSSGAMALEELGSIAVGMRGDELVIHLYGPSVAEVDTRLGKVRLRQTTDYPLDGLVRIEIGLQEPMQLSIAVRIPSWADGSCLKVNGVPCLDIEPGGYVHLRRLWSDGDVIQLFMHMHPRLHHQLSQNTQESPVPDAQHVMCHEYVAITRGPLVYATGLIDGFKTEETLRLPEDSGTALAVVPAPDGWRGPAIELRLGYRPPLTFLPYYEAGGRVDGSWRLTWMQLAPTAT